MGSPRISVIIPTRNRADILQRCLRALEKQTAPSDSFEVVVADDGSTDDTRRILEEGKYKLRLKSLFLPHRGPNAARNSAATEARGDILLFLGDDMIADSEVIAIHLKNHARNPEENIGVLGRIDWHPEITQTPFIRYLGEPQCSFQFSFTGFDPQNAPIGRMYGSHHSVKRSFFERHGGFDEDFSLPAFDDVELEYRYRLSGFRLIYDSQALVHHLHQYDLASFAKRMRMVGTQAVRLYRKFPQCKGFLGIDSPPGGKADEAELRNRITRLEEKERRWEAISRMVSFRGEGGEDATGYNSLRREWYGVLTDSYAMGVREASLSSNHNHAVDAPTDATDMTPVTFARPTGDPETSVIIPVHGLIHYTRQCLAAIRENTEGRYEVIVVDNASPSDMRSFLRRCTGLRVTELKNNPGFSTACNRGAMAARGEFKVFLLDIFRSDDPFSYVFFETILYVDNLMPESYNSHDRRLILIEYWMISCIRRYLSQIKDTWRLCPRSLAKTTP